MTDTEGKSHVLRGQRPQEIAQVFLILRLHENEFQSKFAPARPPHHRYGNLDRIVIPTGVEADIQVRLPVHNGAAFDVAAGH